MKASAFICGCAGPCLSPDENAFFREALPWGLILFARNVETPDQVRALVDTFRQAVGWAAPVLIDQEGGRVQRLKPPHWPAYPAPRRFGERFDDDPETACAAAELGARLIGLDLADLGINIDCLPLLDLAFPQTHDVIGDRAYHRDPEVVARLARATCAGLLRSGVLPVIKHIPGHGRATADSHHDLPRVAAPEEDLQANDFAPFTALADMPLAMTAHIVYTALDPDAPATTSRAIIEQVIRQRIGFDGVLMSDDVSMRALSGTIAERTRALFAAGCDLALHCNGDLAEMRDVARQSPQLAGVALARCADALGRLREPEPLDRDAGRRRLNAMLAPVA